MMGPEVVDKASFLVPGVRVSDPLITLGWGASVCCTCSDNGRGASLSEGDAPVPSVDEPSDKGVRRHHRSILYPV